MEIEKAKYIIKPTPKPYSDGTYGYILMKLSINTGNYIEIIRGSAKMVVEYVENKMGLNIFDFVPLKTNDGDIPYIMEYNGLV